MVLAAPLRISELTGAVNGLLFEAAEAYPRTIGASIFSGPQKSSSFLALGTFSLLREKPFQRTNVRNIINFLFTGGLRKYRFTARFRRDRTRRINITGVTNDSPASISVFSFDLLGVNLVLELLELQFLCLRFFFTLNIIIFNQAKYYEQLIHEKFD